MSPQSLAELGVLQTLEALEHLGRIWTAHQRIVPKIFSEEVLEPRRIFTYRSFRRFLRVFYQELDEARKTLSMIPPSRIQIPFSLMDLAIDFNGDGKMSSGESLMVFLEQFPEIYISERDQRRAFFLDFADILWLRSYLSLIQGGLDIVLSYDWEEVFYQWDEILRLDAMGNRRYPAEDWFLMPSVFTVEENRFPQARDHFLESLRLGEEFWQAVEAERDDAGEWIPGPHQTNWRMDLPITKERINKHLALKKHLIRLLEGQERLELYPGMTISLDWFLEHPRTLNLNNPFRPLYASGVSQKEQNQRLSLKQIYAMILTIGEDWMPFLIWVN
jgi:hypothetical protein